MGLFGKLKDILFEEEDVEEEVIPEEKKTVVKEPVKIEKEEVKEVKEVKEEKKVPFTKPKEELSEDFLGERDLYHNEKSSPFLDFDEEEFSNYLVKPKTKSANVIEYERKKKVEKRSDYGRYEKTEIRETVERKKFKPSPIISPVYGILNEDYHIEDIKSKGEEEALDIDKVRKKAFEKEEEKKEGKVNYFEEETVTVKYEEAEEEKEKKDKTIEDLLEDTTDEIIKVDLDNEMSPDEESRIKYEEIEDELDLDNAEVNETEADSYEKEEKIEEEKVQDAKMDTTTESDLFDLIDSMYDEREDGE